MNYKRMFASAVALSLAAVLSSCAGNSGNSSPESNPESASSSEEELIPPVPVEATDPNTITFDDGNFDFAIIKEGDKDSAVGTLEVADVQGNKMLMFKDDGSNFKNGTVQKIQIDAAKILTPENMAKVRSIEMDIYADATDDKFTRDDGVTAKVPGWIGGGGGANVSGNKWYDFGDWEGGEYNFEMSGAVHAQFKFLLADSGQCWDETMTEASLLIMRWGAKNEGNMYIDNIVFYDADGKSLPVNTSSSESNESKTTSASAKTEEPATIETTPDGGKKVISSDGEVHVYDSDENEDLDQFEAGGSSETSESESSSKSDSVTYNSDGEEDLG